MAMSECTVSSRSAPEPAPAFPVFFYRQRQRVLASVLDAALDIGRQREGEPAPAVRLDRTRGARVILAPIDDVEVSRSHVEVAPAGAGQVRITNTSRSLPLRVEDRSLEPGGTLTVAPSVLIQFGSYAVRVDPPEEEELVLEGLPERTIPPGKAAAPASLVRWGDTLKEESLLQWLETVLGVFQSAANTRDFPEQAARAAVKIVGLDAAAVLRCSEDGRWRVEAVHAPGASTAAASLPRTNKRGRPVKLCWARAARAAYVSPRAANRSRHAAQFAGCVRTRRRADP